MKNSPKFSTGYRVNIGIICIDIVAFSIVYTLARWDLVLCPKWAGNRHNPPEGFLSHDSDNEHHSDKSVDFGGSNEDDGAVVDRRSSSGSLDLEKRGDMKVHAITSIK
ncbi:unnamed protein product [Ambrosiozyma monospora]|uniref:Unnamed protein product n=1 Tax=Ambrosiozyma monospora TaxID=43982 RepID=A0ACB5TJY9_AMBMO|nr:unnamed protein product [Ambrosiozyma monospora]